jgi:DNA-binding CsgD family transcriptional regulator
MTRSWKLCEVPLDIEVPTGPTLRLLATLRRRQLAVGLFDWLAGRAVLRRLAIAEHRPGMSRLVDRVGVDEDATAAGARGWPLGGEGSRWPHIDRHLVQWLHGAGPGGRRVAIGTEGDEACVLVAGEVSALYAVHASRDAELGGFPDDELLRWAKAALLLRQVLCRRASPRSPAPMAERVERAAALLQARATKLSEREQQVVARIACGITNDGIANDLGISPATVLTLRRRAYAKLGIRSCVELSWLAG